MEIQEQSGYLIWVVLRGNKEKVLILFSNK